MERKTKIDAPDGKQDMAITREFDLPLELLFRAYEDPEIVEQWMGTKVLKLESKKHGSYQIETSDPKGNVAFRANGVIHDFVSNQKIVRTFEMENTSFGVQLEVYEFHAVSDNASRLKMHVIYESAAQRDQVLKLPFAQGINWAHNRLEEIMNKVK
ncbi:MAG TPA: SRPBCC domain-containing protein [Hanamia sp.]|nr:SRPBCC domain-containing protein [Hanamia sp.]